MQVKGIHHITAISSDPQSTVDFYRGVLGLRLVKKSVNQDDVYTYHLFFGNKEGSPGMDLTFFPFQPGFAGKRGVGQVSCISLSVRVGSLDFWQKRFQNKKVKYQPVNEVFAQKRLRFFDADGQVLELVEDANIADEYKNAVWETEDITARHAIHCFHSAELTVSRLILIEPVLLLLGYQKMKDDQNQVLYAVPKSSSAAKIQVTLLNEGQDSHTGAGTVHHIAFRVNDFSEEEQIRAELIELGLYPTEVIDRYYFKSIYFRTPAGILFEIATEEPGFTADEVLEHLGEKLALPPFLEDMRAQIEANLPSLR